jgi:hypothetical protein
MSKPVKAEEWPYDTSAYDIGDPAQAIGRIESLPGHKPERRSSRRALRKAAGFAVGVVIGAGPAALVLAPQAGNLVSHGSTKPAAPAAAEGNNAVYGFSPLRKSSLNPRKMANPMLAPMRRLRRMEEQTQIFTDLMRLVRIISQKKFR